MPAEAFDQTFTPKYETLQVPRRTRFWPAEAVRPLSPVFCVEENRRRLFLRRHFENFNHALSGAEAVRLRNISKQEIPLQQQAAKEQESGSSLDDLLDEFQSELDAAKTHNREQVGVGSN